MDANRKTTANSVYVAIAINLARTELFLCLFTSENRWLKDKVITIYLQTLQDY